MFRTVTVHPQELLFRYCMCRLWYVLIRAAGTTFEEEPVLPQTLYQRDVSDSAVLTTYHAENDTRTFQCQMQRFVEFPV